jgi:hypothetical protein
MTSVEAIAVEFCQDIGRVTYARLTYSNAALGPWMRLAATPGMSAAEVQHDLQRWSGGRLLIRNVKESPPAVDDVIWP